MRFQHPLETLRWYLLRAENRILNESFLSSLRWDLIQLNTIETKILDILPYFRDTELLTPDLYYREQWGIYSPRPSIRTLSPSTFRACIAEFLGIWAKEETTHGEVLDRILIQCGYPSYTTPSVQGFSPRESATFRLLGEHYMALHMTWGAINEMGTQAGYLRLAELTENEELRRIFKAIAREEGRHLSFYLNMAQLLLRRSLLSRLFVRWIISKKWKPVGGGEIPLRNAVPTLKLFAGSNIHRFTNSVGDRIRKLPGMSALCLERTVENTYRAALNA